MNSDETGISEPEDALREIDIANLPPALREACARAGWSQLTPVQARTIPYILAGRDLMVQSRTGSGKTGAFVLPILDRIELDRAACQALVLTPTRELARQVAEAAQTLSGEGGVRVVAVFGGVAYRPQLEAFRQGAHIVVGTPGRILDHLMSGALSLKDLRILVLDEADRMLSMGFYQDMRRVKSYMPPSDVNAYMFSATFPTYVMGLAGEFLHHPEMLSLSRDHVHIAETAHVFCEVQGMDKDRALTRIIEIENPSSAIVFCNTKSKTHYVTVVLQRFGYNAAELSADISQTEREAVMARARDGSLRFLVATDIAARGIDIPDLSHVIQYEPSDDPELYVHRAGRTGRMGAAGVAITLVSGMEKIELQRTARRLEIEMEERPIPTPEDVEAIVSQRATALLEARLRDRDKLQIERMRRFFPLAKSLGESDDELNLIAMLIDDYYQDALHAPPLLPTLPGMARKSKEGEGGGARSSGGSRSSSGSRSSGGGARKSSRSGASRPRREGRHR
ncbi:MAG: DEAD/DEAH box helicase [Candidatus Sumerlaeota bacterium]|nr:DEAD/DEAH box helicase [Candidatus Sumerlaeota bacterium]